MKKILLLMIAVLAMVGCNNTKNNAKASTNPIVEKYTDEQAIKAFKDLKWGMNIDEMINLGYISTKDTSQWVIPLKYNQIGNVEFEDVSIMTHDNKLFAVVFHEYMKGFNNSIHKLREVKNWFNNQYGNPEFEKTVSEDSLKLDIKEVLYLWNIKHKRIKGTIEKSSNNMFFVDVVIEDTITRHLHDSIAIAYQSRDL